VAKKRKTTEPLACDGCGVVSERTVTSSLRLGRISISTVQLCPPCRESYRRRQIEEARKGLPLRGSAATKTQRRAVWERDQGRCRYCRAWLPFHACTADHVIPRCQNGQATMSNLVCCCRDCNNRKGDRTPEDAGMTLWPCPASGEFAVARLPVPGRGGEGA
jgi:5-methylcytosine-specific restriction endonuclease McrA